MNFKKSILILSLFFFTALQSQTMVTTNIQSRLLNKYWSPNVGDPYEVVFFFTQNEVTLFVGNKKIGAEPYYITSNSEVTTPTTFDNSKVGLTSTGNCIKTNSSFFIVEFFSDFQSFRWKRSFDPDQVWQTYTVKGTPYFSTDQFSYFTKNNCGEGNVGQEMPYTVLAGTYVSYISQADADAKALADITTYGQNVVNGESWCIYYNKETTREVTKNNCPTGKVGTKLSYTVPAGRYSSEESEEVVDALVNYDFIQGPGQEFANINCSCVYTNTAKYGRFTKNNCPIGAVDRYEYNHTVPAGKYFSNVSQQAADDLAIADLNLNGQIYANANNTCIYKSISRSVTVRRNNCPSGKVGSLYTYTVPAGDKTSTISQADADAQVDATLYYWAQYFANSRGSCN
jgi:Family of unknown function (DUF5977)